MYYTLPLGWEAGACVYHTTGLLATSGIIILGVHPDEGLKSVIHPATARRQNHLVLAALLYTQASSSSHPVKLPVSPSMFLLSFPGVFYIRDLCISGKVSPCLRGM